MAVSFWTQYLLLESIDKSTTWLEVNGMFVAPGTWIVHPARYPVYETWVMYSKF